MKEEKDLSQIGFPVLADPLEEDLPLKPGRCPYCWRSHWIIPRSDYYFTCGCGGISIYDGLTLRVVTAAEYAAIRNIERTKPEKTVGLT